MSKNCPILSLVLHLHHEACWCSEFWKQFLTVFQGQKKLFTVISTCTPCQNFGNSSSLCSKPKRSCSQSFPHALSASATVGSTACTCVLDSLYSPWDDALPHWRCPSLQQVDCERSAASTIFSQRLLLNVQNLSKMQHFGRVRSVSCHTSCASVVHCLFAPLSESSHQARYTSSYAVNDRTSFSSAKVVTLRESPLSLVNNTKTWAPRQCQRWAICPQQPNIERRRCSSVLEAGFLSLIPSPYAKRPENGGSALDAPRFAGRKSGRWSSSPCHGAFSNRSCAHRFAPKWSALTAPRQHTQCLALSAFPSNTVLRAMQRSDPWKLNERRMRICDAWNTAGIDRDNVLARSERACRWFYNETWNF